MRELVKRFIKDEKGLETVEWTLMAALIVLGLVALITSLKDEIANVFTGLKNELVSAQGGGGS